MARYIDVDRTIRGLKDAVARIKPNGIATAIIDDAINLLESEPTADVVEVETIKAWLHEIAIHNMNDDVKLTLFATCQDFISRLDGLRRFAQERRDT